MEYVTIGESCSVVSGGTPSRSKGEFWQDGTIPWIKIGNIKTKYVNEYDELITEEGLNNSSAKLLKKGTILYTIFATLGEVGILDIDACTNQAIAGITINDPRITPDFLYYYLKSKKEYVNSIGRGVAQNNINLTTLRKFEIPLIDRDKQSIIVKTLEKVEKIIDSQKKELDRYDELVKARFVEIFGELSSNPYGWETFTMGECFDITSSKRILKSEWRAQGIPFLRVRDIVQLATTGQMENEYFVSEEFYKSLSDYDGVPQRGDILVSATSTLGKCHVVGEEERYYFKDADVLRFRAKKKINPIFFVELMKEHYIEEQISKTLGITTVAHFTIKAAKNINMRCPDIELQNEFANFVAQVDKSKSAVQAALDKTQLLFDSLMQEYFG